MIFDGAKADGFRAVDSFGGRKPATRSVPGAVATGSGSRDRSPCGVETRSLPLPVLTSSLTG